MWIYGNSLNNYVEGIILTQYKYSVYRKGWSEACV